MLAGFYWELISCPIVYSTMPLLQLHSVFCSCTYAMLSNVCLQTYVLIAERHATARATRNQIYAVCSLVVGLGLRRSIIKFQSWYEYESVNFSLGTDLSAIYQSFNVDLELAMPSEFSILPFWRPFRVIRHFKSHRLLNLRVCRAESVGCRVSWMIHTFYNRVIQLKKFSGHYAWPRITQS